MKFLINNALSPLVSEELNQAGHDAVHVRALGMGAASDVEIFDRAAQENRIVVSADTDFGLLALRKAKPPSVILFRRAVNTGPPTRPRCSRRTCCSSLPRLRPEASS